jgi:PadR family transcriptional regulator, regulatory protein PadR
MFTLGMLGSCLMANTTDTSRDLFPGALEMMILESLRRQPAHGYALVQHIQQRSRNLLQVEEGSLYPALQRLLKAKLVKAEWTISSSTNRRVRIYQITKAGLRHLEREISSFDRMLEGIQMVLGPERRTANS